MKKIISLLGCCFIAISTLTACENNNLPAWADTDVLTPKAQTMIDTLNAFDYDGVAEIYNNPAVDASTFEASGEIIETYGTFESYGNVSYVADKTDDGIEFVRVIQILNSKTSRASQRQVSGGKATAGAALCRCDGSAREADQANLCPVLPGDVRERDCRSGGCRPKPFP